MVKRSKLMQALDAHKGRDYDAEKQKKMVKAAEKRKGVKKAPAAEKVAKPAKDEEEVASSEADEAEEEKEEEDEEEEEEEEEDEEAVDEEDEDEEEEEEDIPLSDLEDDEREDIVPHQRLTINNSAAITSSLKRISFITSQTPFSEHNSLVSKEPFEVEDPNDDLNRELAFYKVCQAAAISARGLLKKEGISFTRPGDYFAEMVKNDEHMDKIKKKLYDEAAGKKAAAEARRQRDLKKFGKQVQVAKLQQRAKEKRETLDKITALKKSMLKYSLNSPRTKANLILQSARLTLPPPPTTPMTCSTLLSRTPTSPIAASAAVTARAATSSAKRRTQSSALAARSASQRAVTPPPVVTCAASPRRR
jgi:rRNA-processing protein EBP2